MTNAITRATKPAITPVAGKPGQRSLPGVSGRLAGLIRQDSPLMQQARAQGVRHANRRGLINSSLAGEAAQQAVISSALPIAQAAALGREQVAELHYRLRKTPVMANLAVGALSRMYNRAEAWGMDIPGGNPCRFVTHYRTRRRERFLTENEFRRLGRTLDEMEAEDRLPAHVAGAIRLLMLTGCRSGEILNLRWEDVRLEEKEIRLRDSKTGPRAVSLSPGAVRVLAGLPRAAGSPWVIPGRKPGEPITQLNYYWYPVRKRAGLDDVRIHDLRHSFASRALALGEDLTMISKLLGHSKIQTTARYAHLTRHGIREAAARVRRQHRGRHGGGTLLTAGCGRLLSERFLPILR